MTTDRHTLHEIDPETLSVWMENGRVQLIDVREPGEFAAERIDGATLQPLSKFDGGSVTAEPDKTVVLHCRSGQRSAKAAHRLFAAGWNEVYHLSGGLGAWKRSGLPVERSERAPISLERQVRIAAGSLVLLGIVLGLVSSWFLLLSGFVGAGLVFAGVTDTCGMGMLLARLPYNQRAYTQDIAS